MHSYREEHFPSFVAQWLLSARTAMWSMPVVLTETENENDSANQNDVAKNDVAKKERALATLFGRWHYFYE